MIALALICRTLTYRVALRLGLLSRENNGRGIQTGLRAQMNRRLKLKVIEPLVL